MGRLKFDFHTGKPYAQWAIQDFTLYSDKAPKLPVPPTSTGRGQGLAHEGSAGARHASLDVLRVLRL